MPVGHECSAMKARPTLRVAFRVDRNAAAPLSVTAVLPDLPGTFGYVCYGHVGQHSECSRNWYYNTRPASPREYRSLLAELRGIYERGPDAVILRVVKRICRRPPPL